MTKNMIKPVLVLAIICIVVAAILAGVNFITATVIEDRENEKANAALLVVLPGAKDFEELELTDSYPSEVKRAYKADKGFVFEVTVKGKDTMTVMCGVDNDGKIVKLDVISEKETNGYKEKVFPNVTGDNGVYNGKDAEALGDEDDAEIFAGATLTSKGIYSAVKVSLDAYDVAVGVASAPEEPEEPEEPTAPTGVKTDEEVVNLALALVEGSKNFSKVELTGGSESLVGVYKETRGLGYVAYVVVMSENYAGQIESEALIYVGYDGKIKNVNRLAWKTSDAIYGYVPPSQELVDAFYARLPGNSSSSIDGVELVTNATNTSTRVVASFKEALLKVDSLILADIPTAEEEVLLRAKALVGGDADFEDVTALGYENIRRIYKDKNGLGFVVYLVVPSSNYENVTESETLVYIGNDGKIKSVDKMAWKTSDAMYGYVPPSQELVDAFYARLPGNSSSSIDGVELVTNATSTSTRVVNSVKQAITAVEELIPEEEDGSCAPRIVGIIILALGAVSAAAAIVITKKKRGGKNR